MMDTRTDKELMDAYCAGGDSTAFDELHRRYARLVYSVCMRRLGNSADAEDATVACFVVFVKRVHQIRASYKLAPWFFACANGLALTAVRARDRRAHHEMEAAKMNETDDRARSIAIKQVVDDEIAGLPARQREALVLKYYEGLTGAEIAAQIGRPERTVLRDISNGVARLKARLSVAGGGMPVEELEARLGPAALLLPLPATLAGRLNSLGGGGSVTQAAAIIADNFMRMLFWKKVWSITAGTAACLMLAVGVVVAAAGGPSATGNAAANPPAGAADRGSPSTASKSRPVVEHYALTEADGYLDGPRREAMGPARKGFAVDSASNIYFFAANAMSGVRVVRADNGMVETISGDHCWGSALPIDEGPAAFIGNSQLFRAGFGTQGPAIAVHGVPIRGGDGDFILLTSGEGSGRNNCVYRIWRNKDKNNRWWFKVLLGRGTTRPAGVVGQSVKVAEATFGGMPDFGPGVNGEIYFRDRGNFFKYDDVNATLTCVLAWDDYADKVRTIAGTKTEHGRPEPNTIIHAEDGSFFVNFYRGTYPIGWVFKISADRQKVEPLAKDAGNKYHDGHGMKSHYFGGPLFSGYRRGGNVFMTAIDDGWVRRLKDGRVSTLCRDGEWREFRKPGDTGTPEGEIEKVVDNKAPYWGRSGVWGGDDYFYIYYLCGAGSGRIWRISPIDFNKPTLAPLVEGE